MTRPLIPAATLGLPKDITLDGELWLGRGKFHLTSQICRSTVRMGRLRTFQHYLERESAEREWLREQRGGRLASQERLRLLARRHTLPHLCRRICWKRLRRVLRKRLTAGELIRLPRPSPRPRSCTETCKSSFPPPPPPPCSKSSEWSSIKFMVRSLTLSRILLPGVCVANGHARQIFDAPSLSALPVETRWAELEKRFGSTTGVEIDQLQGASVRLVHHDKCTGREDLLSRLSQVNEKGGEG